MSTLSLATRILAIIALYVAFKLGKAVNQQRWINEIEGRIAWWDGATWEDIQQRVAHLQ